MCGPSQPENTYGSSQANLWHGTPMTSPGSPSSTLTNDSDDSEVMWSDSGLGTEEMMPLPVFNQESSSQSLRTSTAHTPRSPRSLEVFPVVEDVGHSPWGLQHESWLEFIAKAMTTEDPKFIEAILNQAKPERYEE